MSDEQELSASTPLVDDIRALIDGARQRAAAVVNAELTLLYWRIGQRINEETLHGRRADYGRQTVANLSAQLTLEYGGGWGEKHLRHCLRLA
ncbi:MAG: hypothetical protein JWQ02_613, partial [Capsulimonas sp.]|nr:hypothetical protein [Capsulimonas sp.]